jgi:hypothetical protein
VSRRLRPAIVLAALVLVAACGGGTGSPGTPTQTPLGNGNGSPAATGSSGAGASGTPAAGGSDACSLLTQSEVAAATGKAVGPGVSQNDGLQCQWEYADPSDQFSGLDASISIDTDSTAFSESQQGGPGITPVSGVGDEAYFLEGGLVGILQFRKGTQLFDVGMNVAGNLKDQYPTATQLAVEKQMALAALPRIP